MVSTVNPITADLTNPAIFPAQADLAWAQLILRIVEMNTQAGEVNVLAVAAALSEVNAAASAAAAALSETAALSSSNFKGSWSALTGAAVVPYSVAHLGDTYLLLSNLADVTTKTPGTDPEWQITSINIEDAFAMSLYF